MSSCIFSAEQTETPPTISVKMTSVPIFIMLHQGTKIFSVLVRLFKKLLFPGTTNPVTRPEDVNVKSQTCPSSRPSATFMTCFELNSAKEYCLPFIHLRYDTCVENILNIVFFVKAFTKVTIYSIICLINREGML